MFERYEICDALGLGQTATTHKGFDPVLRRNVYGSVIVSYMVEVERMMSGK